MKVAFVSAIVALAASVASGFVVSSEALTHNQAVMFCAQNNGRLADVTSANRNEVIHELAGRSAWIGSWDYNFYSGQCMQFVGGHIGAVDCQDKHVAICNNPVVYKSAGNVAEEESAGPRVSRRHQKPCPAPSASSSSSSSASECVKDCAPRCGYEYVYLTRYVEQVYTSVEVTTVYTSTATVPLYYATVNAYTVTSTLI